jgi:type II secretory pathway component PulF
MDWAPVLVVVVALVVWIGLIRFVLPRFGIQTG